MSSPSIHAALIWQSNTCAAMGAPLTAEILRLMADDADVSAAFAPVFSAVKDEPPKAILIAAYPLRILGALHFLVLNGRAPRLAALYAEGGGPGLAQALVEASRIDPLVIARFMASPPQTNEVRRSLCLFGGFLIVAAETGLPLRCLELGASAGLNASWERFDYDLGALGRWGDPTSPVKLSGEWTGGAPPLEIIARVDRRAACDQNPVDISDDIAALGLLAYIWPDQPERMARARAAIAVARDTGLVVEKADAAVWAARHAHPQRGVATVIYHSIFMQYPPEETRAAILRTIADAGAAATEDAPFAWLRMESTPGEATQTDVRLTLWPGGDERLLAKVHSHGAFVQWMGAAH